MDSVEPRDEPGSSGPPIGAVLAADMGSRVGARAFYAERLGLVPHGGRHGHLYYRAGSAEIHALSELAGSAASPSKATRLYRARP